MICDDKGFKLSTNNKDRFMQARMLIVVIYHNYTILLWGGGGGIRSLWTCLQAPRMGSFQHRGKLCVSGPCLVGTPLTSPIILAALSDICLLNRGCHSALVRWESCDTYPCLPRAEWGHQVPGSVTSDWRQQSDLRFQNLSLYLPDFIETPLELD